MVANVLGSAIILSRLPLATPSVTPTGNGLIPSIAVLITTVVVIPIVVVVLSVIIIPVVVFASAVVVPSSIVIVEPIVIVALVIIVVTVVVFQILVVVLVPVVGVWHVAFSIGRSFTCLSSGRLWFYLSYGRSVLVEQVVFT